jgi:hypothetical protein
VSEEFRAKRIRQRVKNLPILLKNPSTVPRTVFERGLLQHYLLGTKWVFASCAPSTASTAASSSKANAIARSGRKAPT